jgi:hypothetical protein
MKAQLLNHKCNNDGSMTLFLAPGLDEHILIDLRKQEIEIGKPRETESEQYQAGYEAGREQLFQDFKKFVEATTENPK